VDLNNYNGYFTDTQYLDVLDEDVNLFETYQTGRLYVYTKQATIDKFTYTLYNNEYTVSVQTSTFGNLIIPATHEDLPVTQFSCVNCTSVTGLVLGSNITTIVQQNLFNAGITTLNVHSNVSTFTPYSSTNMLYQRSFANVNKLQAINVSDKNSVFIDLNSNGLFRKSDLALMFGCVSTDLSKKFAASSGSKINNCAFLGVPISSITIPSSVKTIGIGAFSWTSLTTVDISSVTSLGNYAFCECTNLQMVNLSNDLQTISRGAFSYCSALQSINIPTSLVIVLQDAFAGCTSFRGNYYSPGEFVFPSSVEKIYYAVFANCNSLDYVYIPSTARVMPTATSATYSLFGGDSDLVIATDASEDIVTTWGAYWNYYDGSNACTTYYGITLAEGQTIAEAIALSGQVMATSNISDNKECDSDLSIATVNLNNVMISPVEYTVDNVKQDELEAEIVTLNNKKNEYVILSKEKDD